LDWNRRAADDAGTPVGGRHRVEREGCGIDGGPRDLPQQHATIVHLPFGYLVRGEQVVGDGVGGAVPSAVTGAVTGEQRPRAEVRPNRANRLVFSALGILAIECAPRCSIATLGLGHFAGELFKGKVADATSVEGHSARWTILDSGSASSAQSMAI
jgi:hypothetical protein